MRNSHNHLRFFGLSALRMTLLGISFFPIFTWSASSDKISHLIEELKSPELLKQAEAMAQLYEIGPPTVPHLLKHIRTDYETQRWRIFYLLAKNKRQEVIPFLKEAIKSEIARDHMQHMHMYLYSLAHFSGLEEMTFVLKHIAYDFHNFGEPILYKMAKANLKNFLKGIYLEQKLLTDNSSMTQVFKRLRFTPSLIIRLFQDDDPAYQAAALYALRVMDAQGVEPFFSKGLESKDPSVVFQAVLGCAKYDLKTLFPKIVAIIPRFTPNSISVIPEVLRRLNTQKNFLILWKKVKESSHEKYHLYFRLLLALDPHVLIESQKKKYVAEAIPYLQNFLTHQDKNVRHWAIEALIRLSAKKLPDKLIQTLLSLMKDKDLFIESKRLLIELLVALPIPDWEQFMITYLHKPDFELNVLNGLSKLKSPEIIELLITKLEDKKTINKCKVFQILDDLAPLQTKKMVFSQEGMILSFLHGAEAQCRYSALERLVKLNPPYLETVLISFLGYNSISGLDRFYIGKIQMLAIRELKKMKSKNSVPFLIEQMASEDSQVVKEIIEALAVLQDPQAIPPLQLTLLTTQDLELKKDIRVALQKLRHSEGRRPEESSLFRQ